MSAANEKLAPHGECPEFTGLQLWPVSFHPQAGSLGLRALVLFRVLACTKLRAQSGSKAGATAQIRCTARGCTLLGLHDQ